MVYPARNYIRKCCFVLFLVGTTVSLRASDLAVLDSLNRALSKEKDNEARIQLNLHIALIYRQRDVPKALTYASQALELTKADPGSGLRGDVLNFMGDLCFQGGLMDRSAHYFNESLAYFKSIDAAEETALSYMNIGAVYLYLEDLDKARQYHETALQQLSQYMKQPGKKELSAYLVNVCNNLSIIFRELGDFEKALAYLEQGMQIARETPHYNAGMLYNNLGLIYMKKQQWAEAQGAFEQSLALRNRTSDLPGIANTQIHLGKLHEETGDHQSALTYFSEAYTHALAVGAMQTIFQAAEELYAYYEARGPADSALHYLSQAREYEKQINGEAAKSALLKRQLEEDFQQRKREQRHQLLGYLVVGGICLLLAGVFVFYVFQKLKIRLVADKAAVTNTLNAAQDELKTQRELQEKQLAITALQQHQQHEILEGVIEKISTQKTVAQVQDILHELEKTMDNQAWKAFEIHFLHVNSGFYERLYALHPKLSPNERKLCAFLRMSLSTKEIASITGQTTESINKARMRLRKKLNLTHTDISLTEYLAGV